MRCRLLYLASNDFGSLPGRLWMALPKSELCHPEEAFSLAPPARAGVRDRRISDTAR